MWGRMIFFVTAVVATVELDDSGVGVGITERIDNITHIGEEYLRPDPPCPKSVKIELSPRCNYRCGFCALGLRPTQPSALEDMSLDFFKAITTEMYEAGAEEIGLFYLGESLMNPALTVRACEFLKGELGMPYVFLTTNGSLANPSTVGSLMQVGLDSLKFSLNAADYVQFEEVMGVKQKLYHAAIENLKAAWSIREEGKYSTRVYASSIMYDGEQQERMAKLVEDNIKPYVDEHYWLPLYSMGAAAIEREEELGYRPTAGNQGRIGNLVDPLPCWSAFTEGHVRHDGTVSLCCFDADGRFEVGNLRDQSWMEVWNCEKFQEVRKRHLQKDIVGTICEECVAYGGPSVVH